MAKVTDKMVEEMRAKCGWSAQKCRKALEEHGGRVDATLFKLIEAGKIELKELDEGLISQKLLAEARTQEVIRDMQRTMTKHRVKMDPKSWKETVEEIRNDPNSYELMMEEKEWEREEREERKQEQGKRKKGKRKTKSPRI
jgi:hypothetical protein